MDHIFNALFGGGIGSLNSIIFALFVGACLAGFATVYHRRTIGTLVRYLLDAGAFSPETAKTLRESEQDLNFFLRHSIRHNDAFRRIIGVVSAPDDRDAAEAQAEDGQQEKNGAQKGQGEKMKKTPLSDVALYILPEAKERAEKMYAADKMSDANMWMVLFSIAVFAVIAYLSALVVPKLVEMASSLF